MDKTLNDSVENTGKGESEFLVKIQHDYDEFKEYLNRVFESYTSENVDSEIGCSPKELIFENEILMLYRYKGKSEKPFLIISPLINGHYILDILPERSFTSYLIKNQLAPYLIRWKNLDQYNKEYDFSYYVKALKEVVEYIHDKEKEKITLLGHCLGGLIALAYLGAFPNNRIHKYLNLTASINFDPNYLGAIGRITSKEIVDIDDLLEKLNGNIPSDFMNFAFQFINPGKRFLGLMAVFHNFINRSALRLYKALLQWKADNINMSGEFARSLIRDFFQQNKFFNGKMKIDEKESKLENVSVPVLNIMAKDDDIAPYPSCTKGAEKIKNIRELAFPNGGHLAIVTAASAEKYWKDIVSWIKEPLATAKIK